MMNMMKMMTLALVTALVLPLVAAPAAVTVRNTFKRQPAEAATALKRTVGKPISTGYVFIDGKYIPPPYKVERNGLVLRVNGLQVSNPVVPWEEFVKTQEGVTVSKTTVGGGTDGAAEAVPEPEPEPEEDDLDDWDDDDGASSLDDLFDDDPKPKAAKKKPAKRRAAKPRVKKPTVQVSYSFDGAFTPNEKTQAFVAKINAERTRVDAKLRAGGFYFFGSAYPAGVSGDKTIARKMMAKLPEAMKTSESAEALAAAARQAGLVYLTPAIVNDLFKNRIDYLQLIQRRKTDEKEANPWGSLIGP
ncbi:MAG: hypothetical protein IJ173_12365 [Kiritimatiellae bacterium]|nr:hypothetical protein [Kiritimatiellia bacterium]